MQLKNKKILLIAVCVVIVTIAVITILMFLPDSSSKYSDYYKELTIKEALANKDDYEDCNKKPKNCIINATNFIRYGITPTAFFTNYDLNKLNDSFNKTDTLIKNNNFEEAYASSVNTINEVNKNYESYIADNQQNFDLIDQIVYKTFSTDFTNVNYQIINNWAKIFMLPNDKSIMPTSAVLFKENNLWVMKIGPSTFMYEEDFAKYPDIPKTFIENQNLYGLNEVIINKNGRKMPDIYKVDDSSKTIKDPLFNFIPYKEDSFRVSSSTKNGLTTYTVSYNGGKGDSKDTAQKQFEEWLKEINVQVSINQVVYKKN